MGNTTSLEEKEKVKEKRTNGAYTPYAFYESLNDIINSLEDLTKKTSTLLSSKEEETNEVWGVLIGSRAGDVLLGCVSHQNMDARQQDWDIIISSSDLLKVINFFFWMDNVQQ